MHVATARRVAGPVRCAPQAAAEPQTVIACHGFGRVVLTSREHIIGLEPLDKGLMGMLLRYPYEVRNEHKYFDDIQHVEITKEMLDLARHMVIQKTADFEPEKFEEHYEQALTDLISAKRSGKAIGPKPRPRVDNVVNLMDALRQSITSYASKPKKPRKAAAGQKEMLLPIDGKGGSEKKATKSESILGNVRRPRLRVAYRS